MKSTNYRTSKFATRVGLAVLTTATLTIAGVMVAPATFMAAHASRHDSSNPLSIPVPRIKGVPGLPGPIASSASPSGNMGILTVKPDVGHAGTPISISGTGLNKNANVTVTWSSANDTWVVDPEIGTVNYMGFQRTKLNVVLAHTTTDGGGNFTIHLKAPNDFGGVHDIYADINGTQEAHGGFLISRRLILSPKSGPIGTPIHITYTGFSASEYELGAAVLWDNHYTGEMQAVWTRGTGSITIRAAGPVGRHIIEVGDSISFLYLNLQQASDSWAIGGTASFNTTADKGRPKAAIWWPNNIKPTVNAKTTLQAGVVDPNSPVHIKLSYGAG